MKAERVWKAVALAFAAVAAAATLHVWLSGFRYRETLAQKRDNLRQISVYAERWAREEALRNRWEAQQAWSPAELDDMVARTLGADAAAISPPQATPAGAGWRRSTATLEVKAGPYAVAAGLLTGLGAGAPPWRLREINFRPAAEAGQGTMSLAVEALEKVHP